MTNKQRNIIIFTEKCDNMSNICVAIRICCRALIQILFIDSDKEYNYQDTEELFSNNKGKQLELPVSNNNSYILNVAQFFRLIFYIANRILAYSEPYMSQDLTKTIQSIMLNITNSINFKTIFTYVKYISTFIQILLPILQSILKTLPIEHLFPTIKIIFFMFKVFFCILQLLQFVG